LRPFSFGADEWQMPRKRCHESATMRRASQHADFWHEAIHLRSCGKQRAGSAYLPIRATTFQEARIHALAHAMRGAGEEGTSPLKSARSGRLGRAATRAPAVPWHDLRAETPSGSRDAAARARIMFFRDRFRHVRQVNIQRQGFSLLRASGVCPCGPCRAVQMQGDAVQPVSRCRRAIGHDVPRGKVRRGGKLGRRSNAAYLRSLREQLRVSTSRACLAPGRGWATDRRHSRMNRVAVRSANCTPLRCMPPRQARRRWSPECPGHANRCARIACASFAEIRPGRPRIHRVAKTSMSLSKRTALGYRLKAGGACERGMGRRPCTAVAGCRAPRGTVLASTLCFRLSRIKPLVFSCRQLSLVMPEVARDVRHLDTEPREWPISPVHRRRPARPSSSVAVPPPAPPLKHRMS